MGRLSGNIFSCVYFSVLKGVVCGCYWTVVHLLIVFGWHNVLTLSDLCVLGLRACTLKLQ